MPLIKIDGTTITNWETFHNVFSDAFGFPDFYGRNMNAWIDCMTDLDDPTAGMTTIHGSETDPVTLHLVNASEIPDDIYEAMVEYAAFVNWRRIDQGHSAILMLSFNRSS
jgi:barstar (barnase inhibitor)